ncbi:inositol-pentakisphosphate 2-kinase-domain-containing protein [Xylariaceae sp. FL1651]|nr:inositol-pentakisphosphate 2-kinase-domain-containing protein [Xylariaceae sp. FL1651]
MTMEAIWRKRSKPTLKTDRHYDGDLESTALRQCEDLINTPGQLDFKYVAEGRANVVFSIWESKDPAAQKGRFEGTLLRVPKATQGITPCDYKTLHDFHENQVEVQVGPEHLVPQTLINISADVASTLNAKRNKNKDDDSVIQAGYAMLIQDMSESPGYSVLEFKPKWLAQSPIAPPGATRCRTCAREAFRNSQRVKAGKAVTVPICPLGLLHEDHAVVTYTIARLAPEWTKRDRERLADALKESRILEKLRELQTKGDPGSALLDNPSDPAFGLAMTLRDCSCYVRMPLDVEKDVEIKLADVDKKNWEEKQSYWQESHWNLVNNGWYTGEGQDEAHIDTACVLNL